MGEINRQRELQELMQLEEAKFQIELAALQQRRALETDDPEALKRAQNNIEQLTREHNLRLQDLNNKTTLAVRDSWQSMLDPVSKAVDRSVQGMILGTTTWEQAQARLLSSVVQQFLSAGVEMATNWVATEIAKTSASVVAAQTRVAVVGAAAVTEEGITAGTAIKHILSQAAKAAAGAYAAIASIPIVGPVLAPAVSLAALAAVGKLVSNVASAEGGYWRIPRQQLAMVHEQEMILPSREAQGLRNMIEGGGRGGGGGDTYMIQATDARSFERLLRDNPRALAAGLRAAKRNGYLS